MPTTNERFRGCLLGLAVGDAIGTSVEFSPRGTFRPLSDMVGGGPFQLRPGEWTDDTSMALCLAASLVHCDGFDARDQIVRYCRWRDAGYMSCNGRCFDIGTTVNNALERYRRTNEPFSGSTEPQSAGNGSIMRLAPVVMYYFPDSRAIMHYAAQSSLTTHGALECIDGCKLLGEYLRRSLSGMSKAEVLSKIDGEFATERTRAIANGEWRGKAVDDIRGTGYVVECLEAAIWCFENSTSFERAVLAAANLGDDADTTAAVCGQLAGAYYGIDDIRHSWLDLLVMREEIVKFADQLQSAVCRV